MIEATEARLLLQNVRHYVSQRRRGEPRVNHSPIAFDLAVPLRCEPFKQAGVSHDFPANDRGAQREAAATLHFPKEFGAPIEIDRVRGVVLSLIHISEP